MFSGHGVELEKKQHIKQWLKSKNRAKIDEKMSNIYINMLIPNTVAYLSALMKPAGLAV